MTKKWLWGVSGLLGAILMIARGIQRLLGVGIEHLLSSADFGFILLVTHAFRYLINNGFSSLFVIGGLVALIAFIVFVFRQGVKDALRKPSVVALQDEGE
jgi:hypothetical protein